MRCLGLLILGAAPLWADLPVEIVTTPPESVNLRVRRDAIGVWMAKCGAFVPLPSGVRGIPAYRYDRRRWVLDGAYPLDQVRTVSVFGYTVDADCMDFVIYRLIVTRRKDLWIEAVVDVVKDRRIWTLMPIHDTSMGPGDQGYVVWLDKLGREKQEIALIIPGFFDGHPIGFDQPDWNARVVKFERRPGAPSVVAWLLDPVAREGNFVGVTRNYVGLGDYLILHLAERGTAEETLRVQGSFPLPDSPAVSPDTVWVPIRDREGALLIWFGDITD